MLLRLTPSVTSQRIRNLTVTGDLFVNGSTTQVNTNSISVEDRTIELGRVGGNAPTGTTTWDLGVLFNYYDGSAKKSAINAGKQESEDLCLLVMSQTLVVLHQHIHKSL